MEYFYTQSQSIKDLQDILDLQKLNLPGRISSQERAIEGYVTIEHDLALLQSMHKIHPHTIIKTLDHKLVAYALVMDQQFSQSVEILKPMFKRIDQIQCLKERTDESYFVMGQVCIDKQHRKKGLFKKLYRALTNNTKSRYQHCYTEINENNPRSLMAHQAAGLKVVDRYDDQGQNWVIVYLPLI